MAQAAIDRVRNRIMMSTGGASTITATGNVLANPYINPVGDVAAITSGDDVIYI